jgi:hypothetical protein
MEEKEKYEIDGEEFLMQMLDAAAEKINKMHRFSVLAKELTDSNVAYYVGPAMNSIQKFGLSDQVEFMESMVNFFRTSKKLCEKYNIDISKEKEDEEDGV